VEVFDQHEIEIEFVALGIENGANARWLLRQNGFSLVRPLSAGGREPEAE